MDNSEKLIKSNPSFKANIFSKLFFWWLKSLFSPEKSKGIEIKDLYNVLPENCSKSLGDKLERAWFNELSHSKAVKKNPSLFKATWQTFGALFCYYGIHVFIICVILRGLQPYVLGLLIWQFDPRALKTLEKLTYLYAFGLVAMIILQAIIGHHSVVGRKEVGMKIGIAYSELIYRKILRLSISSSNKYNAGKIINMLSNDIAKFEDVSMFLHYIWVLPIQAVLMAYFIWDNVGVASLAGIFFLTIQTVPIQGYLGRVTAKLRAKVASKTDERMRLVSEIVNGIRVIKMYTWEKAFENFVFLVRRREINAIAAKSYLRGVSAASSSFAESTSMFFVILTYVLLGNVLEAAVVYSVMQYFGMIKTMMTVFFPRAISFAAEARVSIQRVQKVYWITL